MQYLTTLFLFLSYNGSYEDCSFFSTVVLNSYVVGVKPS